MSSIHIWSKNFSHSSMAETEKQKWVDKANAIKSSVELDPKTRHKLIEQHIKLVAKEV